jgi:hypothetical protein
MKDPNPNGLKGKEVGAQGCASCFGNSDFGFVSHFDIRISDFNRPALNLT